MKKIILLIMVLFGIQDTFQAQSMAVGTNVVNFGIGVGSGYYQRNNYRGEGHSYTHLPTFYLGFEHGASDAISNSVIGIGGNLAYTGARSKYRDNWNKGYDQRWSDLLLLAKGYYHHKALMGDKWDIYGALMFGLDYSHYSYSYNDEYYRNSYSSGSSIYFAGGLGIGGRVYLTDKFGFYGELGFGAYVDFLQLGVVLKL